MLKYRIIKQTNGHKKTTHYVQRKCGWLESWVNVKKRDHNFIPVDMEFYHLQDARNYINDKELSNTITTTVISTTPDQGTITSGP